MMNTSIDGDAIFDDFGASLIQQATDTLASWLVMDQAAPAESSAGEVAENLALYHLFVMARRRHGIEGVAMALSRAIEIAKGMGEDA